MKSNEEKINPNDLVLKFESKIDVSKYYDFIEVLCQDREYQKDAIKKSIKFFLESKYKSTEELMQENFKNRKELQSFFTSEENYLKDVQLKTKKAVTLDLATGTGKTWVMYGIAQILLAEGLVDQVLVLCPSVTIKNQLIKRFREFSEDENFKKVLPVGSKLKNPEIHDAQRTIVPGDLCVTNIHVIYGDNSSSIKDSLNGNKKGTRTLIINDEAHHYLNQADSDMRRWGEFLQRHEYDFHFILNVTGTPYKENVYFKNVISRFSIKEAIDQKFVKDILYKTETSKELTSEFQKFDLLYNYHSDNNKKYNELSKTITLFITKDIKDCITLKLNFVKFLVRKEGMTKEEAEKKCIWVASNTPDVSSLGLNKSDLERERIRNVNSLETVDADESKVEFIFSVSMLTEGWDVKKVFQIVPHEKRAFNSKLLISQVLGRGLRVPSKYENEEIQLIVANHDSWSAEIKDYVYAVTEKHCVTSFILPSKKSFNFTVDYIKSDKKEVSEKKVTKQKKEIKLPDIPNLDPATVVSERLQSIKTLQIQTITTQLESESYKTSAQIAQELYNNIWFIDREQNTSYLDKRTKQQWTELINKKCAIAGINPNKIDFENRRKTLQSIEVLKRKGVGNTRIRWVYGKPVQLKTQDLPPTRVSDQQLKESSVFRGIYYDSAYKESDKETIKVIEELETGRRHLRSSIINKIDIHHELKTPQNIIICDSDNELQFVERLVNKNKKTISWIKNDAHSNFYAIPYDYREGSHTKNLNFNPDFIIKTNKIISVVEIKFGGDLSDINKAKRNASDRYMAELNKKSKIKYALNFLAPADYDNYFLNVIEKGRLDWHSKMDTKLRL